MTTALYRWAAVITALGPQCMGGKARHCRALAGLQQTHTQKTKEAVRKVRPCCTAARAEAQSVQATLLRNLLASGQWDRKILAGTASGGRPVLQDGSPRDPP